MQKGLNPEPELWKLVEKGDKPIWNKYVNTQTGESSYQEITPRVIQSGDGCNHNYQRVDENGNVQCVKCFTGTRIVTGIHDLQGGKIVSVIK